MCVKILPGVYPVVSRLSFTGAGGGGWGGGGGGGVKNHNTHVRSRYLCFFGTPSFEYCRGALPPLPLGVPGVSGSVSTGVWVGVEYLWCVEVYLG